MTKSPWCRKSSSGRRCTERFSSSGSGTEKRCASPTISGKKERRSGCLLRQTVIDRAELLGCRCRHAIPFTEQRVVHPLLETPSAGRPNVRVFVIPVVLDLVRIAAETDHAHVDNTRRPLRRGRDDVIHVEVTDALYDPPNVLATARSTTRPLGEPLASLDRITGLAAERWNEHTVGSEQVRIVVPVVRTGVDGTRVFRHELLYLNIVKRRQLAGRRRGLDTSLMGSNRAKDEKDDECKAFAHIGQSFRESPREYTADIIKIGKTLDKELTHADDTAR